MNPRDTAYTIQRQLDSRRAVLRWQEDQPMDAKEIETMQAGSIGERKLDMLIAQKVMRQAPGTPIPSYSTDIADAWKVVEKLREQRFKVLIDEGADYAWSCYLEGRGFQSGNAEADTAPLAICRAALMAVSQEEK